MKNKRIIAAAMAAGIILWEVQKAAAAGNGGQ